MNRGHQCLNWLLILTIVPLLWVGYYLSTPIALSILLYFIWWSSGKGSSKALFYSYLSLETNNLQTKETGKTFSRRLSAKYLSVGSLNSDVRTEFSVDRILYYIWVIINYIRKLFWNHYSSILLQMDQSNITKLIFNQNQFWSKKNCNELLKYRYNYHQNTFCWYHNTIKLLIIKEAQIWSLYTFFQSSGSKYLDQGRKGKTSLYMYVSHKSILIY